MSHELELPESFFSLLFEVDRGLCEAVRRGGCADCGGPLHQGHYERKPRGGRIAANGEKDRLRFSLCCGREGCRHRATPPSVRFLGRRVYLEATVLLASAFALTVTVWSSIRRTTEVPVRTVRRWLAWWRTSFTRTAVFVDLRARTVGAIAIEELPGSLLEIFAGSRDERLKRTAWCLLPLTTATVQTSRFLRGV